MGVRGELYSTRLALDGRTYFFNVKENRTGDLFLTIVESKPTEDGDFDRRSIVIFQESSDEFVRVFQKALEEMNKASPSTRPTKPPRTHREAMQPRDDGREASDRVPTDERPRHYIDVRKPRRTDDAPHSTARGPAGDTSRGASRDAGKPGIRPRGAGTRDPGAARGSGSREPGTTRSPSPRTPGASRTGSGGHGAESPRARTAPGREPVRKSGDGAPPRKRKVIAVRKPEAD